MNLPKTQSDLNASGHAARFGSSGYITWICILFGGALARMFLIDRHGLWNNELITVGVLKLDPAEIIRERIAQNHMPLFFVMLKGWTSIFGTEEWALRAPSALFGAMAVWAVGRLADRVAGPRVALLTAASAALHQIWLSTSLDARMYSMVVWVAAESTDAYLAWKPRVDRSHSEGAESEPSRTAAPLIRWAVVALVGIHTHLLILPLLVAHGIDAFLTHYRRRVRIGGFIAAAGLVAVLSVPVCIAWIGGQTKFEPGRAPEIQGAGILIRQIYRLALGDYDALESNPLRAVGYLTLALAVAGFFFSDRRPGAAGESEGHGSDDQGDASEPRNDSGLRFLGIFTALFIGGLFIAASLTSSSVLGSIRYYSPVMPFMLILVWCGVDRLQRVHAGVAAVGMALIFAIQFTYSAVYYAGVGEGYREAVRYIEEHREAGDGLIVVSSGTGWNMFGGYYGAEISSGALSIDRKEKAVAPVLRAVSDYGRQHSRFWTFTYHEKRSSIWKALDRNPDRFAPLGEKLEFGESHVQLFEPVD